MWILDFFKESQLYFSVNANQQSSPLGLFDFKKREREKKREVIILFFPLCGF